MRYPLYTDEVEHQPVKLNLSSFLYRLVLLILKDNGDKRMPHELKPLLQALNAWSSLHSGVRTWWTPLPSALLEIVCQCMTTVSCFLFAKLIGPPFAKFVSVSYMKSDLFKDAIQLMMLAVWHVLQPKIMTLQTLQLRCGMVCDWLSTLS